ncbi:6442_t:CDS:2 [Funneliformis caledonium]|uniref:6442_t:CDS:1 n=1 Tax=Funneliformis caledonium TaxID=1117310 RepID=A0A9N9F9S2_9GLOM|nr:6442_t:CDS:2 [Funneliformis caledonium]
MSNEINETKETVEKRLKKRNIKRAKVLGAYSEEEDRQLLNLFSQYSNKINKWRMFGDKLKRNHKSVRERYVNHLDPTIDKDPLTEDEKLKINSLQDDPSYYKKWAKIAEEFCLKKCGYYTYSSK